MHFHTYKMPEGPEVYKYTKKLEALVGKQVKFTLTDTGKYTKNDYNEFRKWSELPHTVTSVYCRGKNTFIVSDLNVRIKYGLSGCIEEAPNKHLKLSMIVQGGSRLFLNDQLNYGDVTLMDQTEVDEYIATLGPDIMDFDKVAVNPIEYRMLVDSLRKHAINKPIGLAIKSQNFPPVLRSHLNPPVLSAAKINPAWTSKRLADADYNRIYDAMVKIREPNSRYNDFVTSLRVCSNTKPIGIALTNQNCVSGIGNYLRSEVLHCADVSPFVAVEKLRDYELFNLYNAIVQIRDEVMQLGENYVYKVYKNPEANSADLGSGKVWYMLL